MSSDDIVKRLHFIARTDTDLLGYVAQKAADELQQLRAEVERQRATILLLGLADIEQLAAEVKRLRAERDAEITLSDRLAAALRDQGSPWGGHAKNVVLAAWLEARRG